MGDCQDGLKKLRPRTTFRGLVQTDEDFQALYYFLAKGAERMSEMNLVMALRDLMIDSDSLCQC